jgi:hypothetical protein
VMILSREMGGRRRRKERREGEYMRKLESN